MYISASQTTNMVVNPSPIHSFPNQPTPAHFPLKYPQAAVLIGFLVFAVVMLGHIIQTAITIANKVAEEDVT